MDTQTAMILSTILPPELIEIISDHLILALRRDNVALCAKAIQNELKILPPFKVFGRIILRYRRCPGCDEVNSVRYYDGCETNNSFHICQRTRNISEAFYRAPNIVLRCGFGMIVRIRDEFQKLNLHVIDRCYGVETRKYYRKLLAAKNKNISRKN